MDGYRESFLEEKQYLSHTIDVLKAQLFDEQKQLKGKRSNLAASRREMWESAGHFPDDFAGAAEISQYRNQLIVQTETYINNLAWVERLKKMSYSPYFGRFDFVEEGEQAEEKIYVGLGTLTDPDSFKVLVYDWRAPICSVFYRHEIGPADYKTPLGVLKGEVCLKRQYKIRNGQLVHFFDSSVVIRDEMLQEILSRNASMHMKSIVETIQKEQDIVIRDNKHGLVIVQGAAGSGKTSVAMHRIAYLLYEGLASNLHSRNIIIVSPNEIFSQYISNVLPDLGEENVDQVTFEQMAKKALQGLKLESRAVQLERIVESIGNIAIQSIEFKGSADFVLILERFLKYYEQKLHPFEDVYYHGTVVATRQRLKSRFLANRNVPMARRLQYIEEGIWEAITSLRRERLKKIEQVVQQSEGHDLEIKAFSRLLSLKETKTFGDRLRKFTRIDFWSLYKRLFTGKLLFKFTRDMALPAEIDKIIEQTRSRLAKGIVLYEDLAPLFYLKLKIEGSDEFPWIKHVVIDEAQDYSPLQYQIFKMLFRGSDFTVLGDVNQSMERRTDISLYDEVTRIFDKKAAIKLVLSKTYRSSYEISAFTRKILGEEKLPGAFERHDEPPRIHCLDTEQAMAEMASRDAQDFISRGFGSVAIICKTKQSAQELFINIRKMMPVQLIDTDTPKFDKGIIIIPSYMAKGLEFDAVLIFGAGDKQYNTELDKRLLYIACTRALHRLVLYYCGRKSPFIPA